MAAKKVKKEAAEVSAQPSSTKNDFAECLVFPYDQRKALYVLTEEGIPDESKPMPYFAFYLWLVKKGGKALEKMSKADAQDLYTEFKGK